MILEKVSAEPASCRHLHHETRPTNELGIKIDEAPQRASQSVGCHDTSRWAEQGLAGLGTGLGWARGWAGLVQGLIRIGFWGPLCYTHK